MSTLAQANFHATLTKLPFGSPAEEVVARIHRDGGVILENALTIEQVAAINAELDPHLERLPCGWAKDDPEMERGAGVLTKRLINGVGISKTFREAFIDNDVTLSYAKELLKDTADSFWLHASQVVEIQPGEIAQPLHRDIYGYPFFARYGAQGPEVVINFLVALCDFTEEIGATRIIPSSNHWDFSDNGTPEMSVAAELKAGSLLAINAKVVHGGGANVTKDRKRRAFICTFTPYFLVPQEAFALLNSMEEVKRMSPRIQELMGFRSSGSTVLWQTRW